MKKMRYILGLGVMFLSALACTKDGPEAGSDAQISVGAEVAETKAMLDNEDNKFPNNSVITVYDWLDEADDYHMEGVYAQYRGDATWTYVNSSWQPSNAQYRWEEGTHKFFGWLQWDGSMKHTDNTDLTPEKFFGEDGFGLSGQTLTIPSKTMNESTPQFDFVYSGIKTVEYSKGNNPGRVDLEMQHLFTAFRLELKSECNSAINIKSVTLSNLRTKKKASIKFGDQTEVTYTTLDDSYTFTRTGTADSDIVLSPETTQNVFVRNDNEDFQFAWPQTKDELDDVEITIVYRYAISQSGTYTSKSFKITDIKDSPETWDAGKKHKYTILFDKEPGSVEINYIVAEWDDVEWELDFEEPVHTMLLTSPDESEDVPSEIPTLYYDNSDEKGEQGAFVSYFMMKSPKGLAWKPTLTNASANDYEVRVYTNKDETTGTVHDTYDILITSANIEAENNRYYKIVVVAKNPDNIGKVVKLGLSYAPLWNEEANPLLIVNKASDRLYYPWTNDTINPDNNPDMCWVSIKQVENTSN